MSTAEIGFIPNVRGMFITAGQVYKLVWSTTVHTEDIIRQTVDNTQVLTEITDVRRCTTVTHETVEQRKLHTPTVQTESEAQLQKQQDEL
jgi:hypothetical protein